MVLSANKTVLNYAAVTASIIIALSPALFFSFGYHNDFNAWAYDSSQTPQPEVYVLFALGRYFGAYAENLQFLTIHSLDDLWRWRLVAIVSAALLAVYYLHIVSMRRPPTWQNACLTVAVFTLPTMQFQALWVSMYAFWTPPFLLALVAANLLLRATDRDIVAESSAISRFAVWVTPAFISLLSACFFYPLSATFVLVPAAHLLLTVDSRQVRQVAALTVAILGGAFVALFAIHKFIVLPRLSYVPYLGEYAYNFSDHPISEAFKRITTYFEQSAHLWLTLQIPHASTLIVLLLVIGAIIFAVRGIRQFVSPSEAANVLMACFLFIVAAGPLLIVQQFTTTYRVMFTMTGIELLVLFWLLNQFPFGSLRLAMLFAACGVVLAFVGVYGTSASNHSDYDLFSKATAKLSPQEFHSITVLRPKRWRQVWGIPLDKDFGALNPVIYIFDSLIGTRYNHKASFGVTEIRADQGESVDDALEPAVEKNSIVIDTSAIYGSPNFKDLKKHYPLVSAQPRGDWSGPANAVDHDPNTAWEVVGDFPMELEIHYPTAHTLRGYSLATLEATERMPNRWEIWVSSDLIKWRRIHEMTECQPWKLTEVRHYDVETAADVTGIRLVIKGTDARRILRLYEFTPVFVSVPSPNWKTEIALEAARLRPETCGRTRSSQRRLENYRMTETKGNRQTPPPELLYEYKGYNIVRARGLYVAVAQDAGPVDVGDVLTNVAPRPPADKFMIAHDAASLETAIDALPTMAEPASAGQ